MNSAEEYFKRGLERWALGDVSDAIYNLNKAIEANPDYAEAYAVRGAARQSSGYFAGATEDYAKALGINRKFLDMISKPGFWEECFGNSGKNDAASLHRETHATRADGSA